MAEHVYKVLELVGTSEDSISDAIDTAIEKAARTVRNLGWFQVVEVRGSVRDGTVDRYQVTLKAGFTLDEGDEDEEEDEEGNGAG